MFPVSYLQRLNERLATLIQKLPETTRNRHADWLRRQQNDDGGFSGREGGSDLYYTAFALRSLAILNALDADTAKKSGEFLKQSLLTQASVVDFYSLLYACLIVQVSGNVDVLSDSPPDWPDRVAEALESVRAPDAGFGKKIGDKAGSTYHTFLVSLCYQLLNRPIPQADELIEFVLSRHRDDGGFVEMRPMRKSGTNPTAAAVGTLQILEDQTGRTIFDEELRESVIDHLCNMAADGGFCANGRIPFADVLSTFTGCWTLDQLNALDEIEIEPALKFVQSVENDAGGFHAGEWDTVTDVEYTFYGLGALGLLS